MFIRTLINILFLIIAAYGSYKTIMGNPHITHTWQYYLTLISPWVLLPGSIKAWHQCTLWRRMSKQKNIAPHLSRGQHQPKRSNNQTSILEHACQALCLIAVAAICKQLEIPNTLWIMGGAWGSYFMLRLAIGKVK